MKDDADAANLRKKAAELDMPEPVVKIFERELSKLSRYAPQSPDYSVQLSYLELLTDLPWGKNDAPVSDIAHAHEVLDADHFGLEKVKERILEQIAMLISAPSSHAPIICLVVLPESENLSRTIHSHCSRAQIPACGSRRSA